MPATASYEVDILEHILGDSHDSFMPATVYVGLFTVLPTDVTSGTEVASSGSYARVGVTNSTAKWGPPTTTSGITSLSNNDPVVFTTATGTWGTVVGWGLWDASTSGALILWNPLVTSADIVSTDPVQFDAGALIVTLA